MAAPTRPHLVDASKLVDGAEPSPAPSAKELKQVQMFQANIRLQSGKVVAMWVPIDVTDADVLDLIMEIAKNISATARQASVVSLLHVPGSPNPT